MKRNLVWHMVVAVFVISSLLFGITQVTLAASDGVMDSPARQSDAFGFMPVHGLWVFRNVVFDPVLGAGERLTLVQRSAASGVTDLYVSVYSSKLNSVGRRMFQEPDIADLITQAHAQGIKVWAAYGNTDWPTIGCGATSWPRARMQDVIAYNTRNPLARFDGVMLDVEPPTADAKLLTLYECLRSDVQSAGMKLGAAISGYWHSPVVYPANGSSLPVYQHVINMALDSVVVMGYWNTAAGIINIDRDEILYAASVGKPSLVLVGLETSACAAGQCTQSNTFYQLGQSAMMSAAQTVQSYFTQGFGGFTIHNYGDSYLSGITTPAAWPTTNP